VSGFAGLVASFPVVADGVGVLGFSCETANPHIKREATNTTIKIQANFFIFLFHLLFTVLRS
jgi:hypothetical protein